MSELIKHMGQSTTYYTFCTMKNLSHKICVQFLTKTIFMRHFFHKNYKIKFKGIGLCASIFLCRLQYSQLTPYNEYLWTTIRWSRTYFQYNFVARSTVVSQTVIFLIAESFNPPSLLSLPMQLFFRDLIVWEAKT